MIENVSHAKNTFLKRFYCLYCCLSILLLLSGCTSTLKPPTHLNLARKLKREQPTVFRDFKISGKLGFSHGKQGGHTSFQWEQCKENYRIRLIAPFSNGSLYIIGNPKQVSLTLPSGEHFHANSPERLLKQHFGWALPVSGLSYWLRGMPAPGRPLPEMKVDDKNRIWQMKQYGWTITYQAYQQVDDLELPRKILLHHQNLQLKLILNHWQLISGLY